MQRAVTSRNGYEIEHLAEIHVKSVTATLPNVVCPHCGKVAVSNAKVEYNGGFYAVDLLSGSWKHGLEIQFNYVTSLAPVIKPRVSVHNGWSRVEVHADPDEAAKLVRALK